MQQVRAVQVMRVVERVRVSLLDLLFSLLISLLLIYMIASPSLPGVLATLRLLLGAAYVLFLPGYWLTAALFPGAGDLDRAERIGLSLGLSVAWASVLAMILDRFFWGIHLWPILVGECLSICLFMVVALVRRFSYPPDQVYAPGASLGLGSWWTSLHPREKQIYHILLGALLIAGFSVSWVVFFPTPSEVMTEFYMTGQDGKAEDYPRITTESEELWVNLGVTNQEYTTTRYHVQVWVDDTWSPDRRAQVAEAGPFTLTHGETREWPIRWQMPWTGDDQEVELLLFKGDQPEPYRRLRLFIDVLPGE